MRGVGADADKAYGSINNYEVITEHGATPYIDFKSNHSGTGRSRTGNMDRGTEMWQRMYHMFKMHSEEFYEHYHQRSNVESVMSMMKAKFGDVVRSKSETAMLNEVLCKIVCHNICVLINSIFELGIDLDWLLKPNLPKPNLRLVHTGPQSPAA